MSDERKDFHLGDILSVTHDRLVSPRHIEGVYDILNWMTRDNLFTHQLPRAARECAPNLLLQHPQLGEIDATKFASENWRGWLDEQCVRYGETLPVARLPEHEHEFIDPISEAAEKIHPDRIVCVTVDSAASPTGGEG